MIILAIETSCDETSVAFLNNKKVIINSTISQVLDHSKNGGVIPSLASRLHLKNIKSVFSEALEKSKVNLNEIDYIAYTSDPGLVICLQIGKIFAETFSLFLKKPLIPCNHLLGHSYASLINKEKGWEFPALSLIVSGGHTTMYEISNHLDFNVIGETLDDAVGECLDKAAIIMGYSYPGGPVIENLALDGKKKYKLPIPKNDDSLDFSFSGLKSEIRRIFLRREKSSFNKNDLSFSLQNTIAKIISKKILLALTRSEYKTVIIGGGVIFNDFFRFEIIQNIKKHYKNIEIFIPEKEYCTDNAAMIGILAYYLINK